MKYDQKTDRYRDAKGKFVSRETIRTQIEKTVEVVGRKNRDLTEKLFAKEMSLAEWKKAMRENIKNLHTLSGAVGKGGRKQMSKSDWGKTGAEIKKQYKFLDKFAVQIEKNQVSEAMAKHRASLYSREARTVHGLMEMRANSERRVRRIRHASESCSDCISWSGKGFVSVEEMPPLGSLICGSGCKCGLEYK